MDFLEEIAGSDPVPAGGAAAAYSTCLAVGLIYKVVLLEIKRGIKENTGQENLFMIKKDIDRLFGDVKKLVAEDPERYQQFVESRRTADKSRMKIDFQKIVDVSMRVMEKSDYAFFWINQLLPMIPEQLRTHLQVACELLMGSINATAHVARRNIQPIKNSQKKERYLIRINELLEDYNSRYVKLITQLASIE